MTDITQGGGIGSDFARDPSASLDEPAAEPNKAAQAEARYKAQVAHRFGGIPRIKGNEDLADMQPGQRFIAPDNSVRQIPWEVTDPEDFRGVPDDSEFRSPDGQIRRKPKYESLQPVAETLYNMAGSHDTRMAVLEKFYPGQVKLDPAGDPFVDDNGTYRRGGRGFGLEKMAAMSLPTAGIAVGSLFGGVLGGTAGAVVGESANKSILALSGIHQDAGEVAGDIAISGGLALGGGAIAKAAEFAPAVGRIRKLKSLADAMASGQDIGKAAEGMGITPTNLAWLLGAAKEDVERFDRLSRMGAKVAPSLWAKEAPYLRKIIEQFDPVFRGRNIFRESALEMYEERAGGIARSPEIGAEPPKEGFTKATAPVSSREAGELAIARAQGELSVADKELEEASKAARAAVVDPLSQKNIEVATQRVANERLRLAVERNVQASQQLLDGEFAALRADTDLALATTKGGRNAASLWQRIGGKYQWFGKAVKERAGRVYDAADAAAGGVLPDASGLIEGVSDFVASLPESFRSKYPEEVRMLERMGGKAEEVAEDGKVLSEAVPADKPTFGQLRRLRSWFRYGIDYTDLTPGMREGSLKYYERAINNVLHDSEAAPELRNAVRLLDQADAFYKKNIPFLNDHMVTTVMRGLESGVGSDPKALVKLLFNPERTAAMIRARRIMGPNLWSMVQAADIESMLDASKTLLPGEVDGQIFAKQVEQRVKNGILEAAHSKQTANRLMRQARNALMAEGKLPIQVEAGDTLSSIIEKADAAAREAKTIAIKDPEKAIEQEIRTLDGRLKKSKQQLRTSLRSSSLGVLYGEEAPGKMSQMAITAADTILRSPDRIIAVANKWGTDSAEFDALRKVYALRWFQRPEESLPGMRAELAKAGPKAMPEEVQQMMFPGVTKGQMVQLAQDMEWLFEGGKTDAGTSIAVAARVFNPQQALPSMGVKSWFWSVPFTKAGARMALGKMFATLTDFMTNPAFAAWLNNGLKNGTKEEREAIKTVVNNRARKMLAAQAAYLSQQLEPQSDTEQ